MSKGIRAEGDGSIFQEEGFHFEITLRLTLPFFERKRVSREVCWWEAERAVI